MALKARTARGSCVLYDANMRIISIIINNGIFRCIFFGDIHISNMLEDRVGLLVPEGCTSSKLPAWPNVAQRNIENRYVCIFTIIDRFMIDLSPSLFTVILCGLTLHARTGMCTKNTRASTRRQLTGFKIIRLHSVVGLFHTSSA